MHCCKRIIFKFCKSFDGWASIVFRGASVRMAVAVGAAGGKPTLQMHSVKFNVGNVGALLHSLSYQSWLLAVWLT